MASSTTVMGGAAPNQGTEGAALPQPPPSPKSPPTYPDFCGRHRLQVGVQSLNREIGFLEDELHSLNDLPPASICCKGVNDFVGTNPDPLLPSERRKQRCHAWRWFGAKLCMGFSWICCYRCSCKMPKSCCYSSCKAPKSGWCCSCVRPQGSKCCSCAALNASRCCCCSSQPKCSRCCRSSCSHQCCCWDVFASCRTCCSLPSFSCPEFHCGCVVSCSDCGGTLVCPRCRRPCCISRCLCP